MTRADEPRHRSTLSRRCWICGSRLVALMRGELCTAIVCDYCDQMPEGMSR
jgi:hypothetical protein